MSPYLGLRGEALERGGGRGALPVEVELEQRGGSGIRRRAIITSCARHGRGTVIPLDGNGR